jgi:HK97 family phage major capsid protein
MPKTPDLQTIAQGKLCTRTFRSIPNTYDKEKRSVRAVIASEAPTKVFDWERFDIVDEVLLMDGMELPENRQVPLLDCHQRYELEDMIGSCRDFAPNAATMECGVYFDSTDEGTAAETKMREGHLTDLSAGYDPLESTWIGENETGIVKGRTFTGPVKVTSRWRLREVSAVPIGADEISKFRTLRSSQNVKQLLITRGLSPDATEEEMIRFLQTEFKPISNSTTTRGVQNMDPDKKEPTTLEIRTQERQAEKIRQSEIRAIADKYADRFKADDQYKDMESLRNHAIDQQWNREQFSEAVLDRIADGKRTQLVDDDTAADKIGMSKKDLSKYSLTRAILELGSGRQLDGIEREASDAYAAKIGIKPNGIFLPPDLTTGVRQSMPAELTRMLNKYGISARALSSATAAAGGYTVGTEVLGASMIELLRNKTRLAQMGARQLSGLKGNIAIPRQAGGATTYWLSPNGTVTASDQSFAQLGLTPHRLVGDTAYDKELMVQSSIDVEAFVREDLMRVLAIAKDLAGINGSGVNGQPLGIMNLTGLNTQTFSGAPTWAKVVEFNTKLGVSNVAEDSRAWLSTPGVQGKWLSTPKATNYPIFIMDDGGKVLGKDFFDTNQVPSDKVIYGNWSDLIMADWAGIDVVVDPYSLKKTGQIEVTIMLWCDFGARHTPSFCVSTDSGAQ